MSKETMQRLAVVLQVLVHLALIANVLALFLVTKIVRAEYVDPWWYQEMLWDSSLVWQIPQAVMLILFLWFCGGCTLVILWQGRRVLNTVLEDKPFSVENAIALKWAAGAAFAIAIAALMRLLWSVWYAHSAQPLISYNTLFIPLFAMAGLLAMVMSALFRQAVEMREENDLII